MVVEFVNQEFQESGLIRRLAANIDSRKQVIKKLLSFIRTSYPQDPKKPFAPGRKVDIMSAIVIPGWNRFEDINYMFHEEIPGDSQSAPIG